MAWDVPDLRYEREHHELWDSDCKFPQPLQSPLIKEKQRENQRKQKFNFNHLVGYILLNTIPALKGRMDTTMFPWNTPADLQGMFVLYLKELNHYEFS